MQLENQVAIVTGAGRGIGRAVARQLAAEGAQVGLISRTAAQLDETAALIDADGGAALAMPTDVADAQAMEAAVAKVEVAYGPVDLIVNNAGSFQAIGPIWEVDPETWWTDVTINIRGVFLGCRAVASGMVQRGRGRIINLIGGGTDRPFPYGTGYGTSKAAVMRFTESLAAEMKEHGVQVFAMNPGLVRTEMTEYQVTSDEGKRWKPNIAKSFAAGRDVPPTLAAELAVKLASGCFDQLAGRAFGVHDDMDAVAGEIDNIREQDLYTLRIHRL